MGEINLDAARAARVEAGETKHTVRFGGKKFVLPSELPIEFMVALGESTTRGWPALIEGLRLLLDGQFDDFYALHPTADDMEVLSEGIAKQYLGTDLPNSSTSGASSKRTSSRSRRTSSASTS